MTENTSEKVNKSHKKLSGNTIAIIIAFALIAVYVFYECYAVSHIDVETFTASPSTVYESIEAKALVVRDEHIIENDGGAVTVASVSDGEKVKVNGNVAMEFSSAENAKKYSDLQNLHSRLDYYLDLQSKSAGVATDVEKIDRDIADDINYYVRNTANYRSGNLDTPAKDLNDKLTRRQMIIGENIDFSKVTGSLQDKISKINADSCVPTGYVKTDESGIFSSYTDGCETLFDYDDIRNISVSEFDSYIKQVSTAKKTENLGKIIENYEWYFCCKVTAEQVKDIQNGDKLMVEIKNSGEVLECEVLSGATLDMGVDEAVLVLRSSEMDGEITSMRLEDIEIRCKEYTGFKVPSTAIHIDENGNKGVYALIANQAAFRKGEIIYSTKDYAIFKYDSKNEDSIRLYDQIITKGKDLHHGKVYT